MARVGQKLRIITCLLLTINLTLATFSATKKYNQLLCQHIDVTIQRNSEQVLLVEKDILALLQGDALSPLLATPLKQINTYQIKTLLTRQPLVNKVQVYKNWEGHLKIIVATDYVMARLIDPIGPHNEQMYITAQGTLIPIHHLPSLPLLIISGHLTHMIQPLNEDLFQICDKDFINLLQYIYADDFFRHQITSLEVANNHKITLGTQVGNHKITFGKAKNIPEKFEKLRLFYKQVIPYKGWNAYQHVNLEFENQLICE